MSVASLKMVLCGWLLKDSTVRSLGLIAFLILVFLLLLSSGHPRFD